jgi:amidase
VSELHDLTAVEQGAAVRRGEVSPRELVSHYLDRADEVGAFVTRTPELALARAETLLPLPDDAGPLYGVPTAIKDLNLTAGVRTTFGSAAFADFVPDVSDAVTLSIEAAGLVSLGKTNTPEFGSPCYTEPEVAPPAVTPWDRSRMAGGSSGGAAAAVAAGLAPVAQGSDGGGSIRIPASCCGLVGLKPTRGRVSRGPDQGDDFLVQDGVLTRTVAETAAMLDILTGYEVGDATWAPPPSEPFAAAAKREPGRLRIGYTTTAAIETDLDPLCEQAVRDAAQLLSELGHDVEEVAAPWAEEENLLQVFTMVFGTPIAMGMFFGGLVTGREPTEELVEPLSWTIWNGIRERSALDYLLARTQLTGISRGIIALWESYDVVLTPGLAERPVRIGEIDACSDDPWEDFRRSGRFTPYTAIFNVTGQPAISVPLFHGDDGLPTSIQLAGRPADEGTLLSLAAQLEAARPWADRRPELATA